MKANKATKEALTGLQWAIQQTIEEPRHPDEFTVLEMTKAANVHRHIAQRRLVDLVESGACTRRRMGKEWLYRKAR